VTAAKAKNTFMRFKYGEKSEEVSTCGHKYLTISRDCKVVNFCAGAPTKALITRTNVLAMIVRGQLVNGLI
jgi:hypothetical protein